MSSIQKVLLTIVMVIVVSLVVLIGVIKMVDVNKYIPQIAEMIKKETGRDFFVDRVGLDISLSKGLLLNMDGVRLLDDPAFSKQSFLTMKRFSLSLDVMALLLDRKIKMMDVDMIEPHLIIIRRFDGMVNVASFSPMENAKNEQGKQVDTKKEHKDISALALLIEKVMITKAKITYVDQTFPVPLNVGINDVDVVINNFSLTTTFSYEIKAKAFAEVFNVLIKGKAKIDVLKQAFLIEQLKGDIDLGHIVLNHLVNGISMVKDMDLKSLKGILTVTIDVLNLNAKGLGSFDLEAFIKDGYLLSGLCPLPFEKIQSKATIDQKSISIDSLVGEVAKGTFFLKGLIRNYMTMPSVALNMDVEDIQMQEITKAYKLPIQIIGQLKGRGQASFAGKTPDEMMVSMRGNGEFYLGESFLNGQSLLGGLFHKIPMLSNVLNMIAEDLPASAQKSLTQATSVIKEAQAFLTMEGKVMTLNKMSIEADTLTIETRGVLRMPDLVDMQADVYLQPELSTIFVRKVSDFSNLLQDDKVYIPVQISGTLMKLKIQPNVTYLTEKLLIEQKGRKLISDIVESPKVKKILNSIFGSN